MVGRELIAIVKHVPYSVLKKRIKHHKEVMVLNGLGFVERCLYLYLEFFSAITVDRLLGDGVTTEHLNDDVIGRTLDAIKKYSPEQLFQEIINWVFLTTRLGYHRVHLDTTNFSVHGAYDTPARRRHHHHRARLPQRRPVGS